MNKEKPLVIGLTGGISSGKSTVAAFLSSLGAAVVSADEIGHDAFLPDTEIWREVVKAFGEGILKSEGEIDRIKLGEIVFNDAQSRERLNAIMHPGMYRIAERRIKELVEQGNDVIVLEAPLLIEAHWLPLVDQVWVTIADEDTVVKRLCQRNGFTEDQALARIHSQLPAEEKAKYADVVINTDGSLDEVEFAVKDIWTTLPYLDIKEKIRKALAERDKKTIEIHGITPAAVLIPVYRNQGENYIVVTKRTEEVHYHKGQISFPGGKLSRKDRNLMDTAIRESCEEIGLDPKDVEVLGELDDILTNTNFIITPFVAAIPYPYDFRLSEREVDEVIEVPLSVLLNSDNVRETLSFRLGESVTDYSYEYGDWIIWGATARILNQFLKIVFGG